MKIKILNESMILKESYDGLYKQMDIDDGTLDIFLNTFSAGNEIINKHMMSWIQSEYGDVINGLTIDDIPESKSGGTQEDPLTSIKAQLLNGTTYWWFRLDKKLGGQDAWKTMIAYKVIVYYDELESRLEEIDYQNLTPKKFKLLPAASKNVVFEKHFWEDYLDDFFNEHMSKERSSVTHPKVASGLYGLMSDWFMTNSTLPVSKYEDGETDGQIGLGLREFREEMREESLRLKQEMPNTYTANDDPIGQKKPEIYPPDRPKDQMLPNTGFETEADMLADFEERTGMTAQEYIDNLKSKYNNPEEEDF